jgi:hypothetical protein
MVAEIVRSAGEASILAFATGGMGSNHSDTQSMVLLPELLYRHAFGRQLLTVPPEWARAPSQVPLLAASDTWHAWSTRCLPAPPSEPAPRWYRAARSLVRRPTMLNAALVGARAAVGRWRTIGAATATQSLDWQPAQRYKDHWPRMQAFALPSFYDGRIRINLKGRERSGTVEPSRYEEVCEAIEALLRECRNPLTGEPAVESIERPWTRDPLALEGSESDLLVIWRGVATALEHPRLGLVGPVPLRRTGGHTGRYGVAYLAAPGVAAGERHVRSSFDVAPTMVELLGSAPVAGMTGRSLLSG